MQYYIDFENVGTAGLVGIENLTENDCVKIYYSNNPNVNMETVINIKKSASKMQFLKLCDSIKNMNRSNALDIVIVTDIYHALPTLNDNSCVIISKDKDYDSVISELNAGNNIGKIFRALNILQATKRNFVSNNKKLKAKPQKIKQLKQNRQ